MVQSNVNTAETPLITIAGATGTGKTSLSLLLAEEFGLEIVNCDASQFYRGMDIGTAKPTAEELDRAPHHLFDIAKPTQPLNAGEYVTRADETIKDISERGRTALVVGGTGLYHRALVHGLAQIPEVSPETRQKVLGRLEEIGIDALQEELARVDPTAAAKIARNDPQRTTRALEVYEETGKPLSWYQQQHQFAPRRYHTCKLGVELPRDELRSRMRARVTAMFDAGFPDEVRRLLSEGYSLDMRTFKALGYRNVAAYLNGELTREEVEERIFHLHWQYSRRQRTWFKKDSEILWVSPHDPQPAVDAVQEFLSI